jgi:hypothetical protein
MVKTTAAAGKADAGIGIEKSLAFEMLGGRLKVKLEDDVPAVRYMGETYYITEGPSVTVRGKKYFVDDVG